MRWHQELSCVIPLNGLAGTEPRGLIQLVTESFHTFERASVEGLFDF